MKNILVTGARSHLGSAAIETLAASGYNIKAASRHPNKIPDKTRVLPVLFDYENFSTYDAALSDVQSVLLIAPGLDTSAPEKLNPFIDRAKQSGISRMVFVSTLCAGKDENHPLRRVELHLMESGVRYVIFRPNFFMDHFRNGFLGSMLKKQNGLFLPANGGKISFISVLDVAKIIPVALRKEMSCQTFNLSGVESLNHDAVARIISSVAGRRISYYPVSEKEMCEKAQEHGLSEPATQYLSMVYQSVRAGKMEAVYEDTLQLTGERPMLFSTFARKYTASWQ